MLITYYDSLIYYYYMRDDYVNDTFWFSNILDKYIQKDDQLFLSKIFHDNFYFSQYDRCDDYQFADIILKKMDKIFSCEKVKEFINVIPLIRKEIINFMYKQYIRNFLKLHGLHKGPGPDNYNEIIETSYVVDVEESTNDYIGEFLNVNLYMDVYKNYRNFKFYSYFKCIYKNWLKYIMNDIIYNSYDNINDKLVFEIERNILNLLSRCNKLLQIKFNNDDSYTYFKIDKKDTMLDNNTSLINNISNKYNDNINNLIVEYNYYSNECNHLKLYIKSDSNWNTSIN